MILCTLFALAAQKPSQALEAETRALRITTVEDAIARLPATRGRVVPVGDVDGHGAVEVAIEHRIDSRCWIDFVSVRDGSTKRRMWGRENGGFWTEEWAWDVGDVDGDGVADLILGLPQNDAAGVDAGAVVIVSGADARVVRRVLGSREAEVLGASVLFAGDLDGDGRGDYWVGALEHANTLAGPESGSIMERLDGGVSRTVGPGFVSARSGRDDSELWRVPGDQTGHRFGSRLLRLTDFDGDGKVEVLVQCGNARKNRTVILNGDDGRLVRDLGPGIGGCSSVGDFNDDGRGDLALQIVHGDGNGTTRGDASSIVSVTTSRQIFTLTHPDEFPWQGVTESLGDLDGDGVDDLAVTEAGYQPSPRAFLDPATGRQELRGRTLGELIDSGPVGNSSARGGCAWIVSGRTHRPIWALYGGSESDEWLGWSVCAVPDVSGDGRPDVIVAGSKASYVFAGPQR